MYAGLVFVVVGIFVPHFQQFLRSIPWELRLGSA
jgi:hypothetical protein